VHSLGGEGGTTLTLSGQLKKENWNIIIAIGIIFLLSSFAQYVIFSGPNTDESTENNYMVGYICTAIPALIGITLIYYGIRLKLTE
jgi:heme/copper-type cytochrome/quinol oxidase subunit 2